MENIRNGKRTAAERGAAVFDLFLTGLIRIDCNPEIRRRPLELVNGRLNSLTIKDYSERAFWIAVKEYILSFEE